MNVIDRISKRRILVVGDIMLDRYYLGSVDKISPEAPVPVFNKRGERQVAGGAANVVANLAAAGQDVAVVAVVGRDAPGEALFSIFEDIGCETGLVVVSDKRRTPVKTRVVADGNYQLVRIDEEDKGDITAEEEEALLRGLVAQLPQCDALILSDYSKGTLTWSFCQAAISECRRFGKPVLVDVKDKDPGKYKGATLLKPNAKELAAMTGLSIDSVGQAQDAARRLLEAAEADCVIATLGGKGMVIASGRIDEYIPCKEREVFDVSGAGDTAIAYLAVCIANGLSMLEAAKIANCASGLKVTKAGTAPVGIEEVRRDMLLWEDAPGCQDCGKVVSRKEMAEIKRCAAEEGKRVVFTNGCFDILHAGHVGYLRQAAELGDMLVVGLNSDLSVRRLKGPGRPVNCQEDRAELLCALEFVDYVILFDEDTPEDLIRLLRPDVLVKGADYLKADVVGASFVEGYGGTVRLIPLLEGRSTTGIIDKAAKLREGQEC